MPIVGFKPTKVRLVIEQTKESVVVMKVVASPGEAVELATGGRLEALSGVLRIREQKRDRTRKDGRTIGSLVFIDASGHGEGRSPGDVPIDISMPEKKFEALLNVAISNRLPSKFFVQAGERVSTRETRGMTYVLRPKGRIKRWDNRCLPLAAGDQPLDGPAGRGSRIRTGNGSTMSARCRSRRWPAATRSRSSPTSWPSSRAKRRIR